MARPPDRATRDREERELRAALVGLPLVLAPETSAAVHRIVRRAMTSGEPVDVVALRDVFARQLAAAEPAIEASAARTATVGARSAARTWASMTGRALPPRPPLGWRLSERMWGAQAERAARDIAQLVRQVQAARTATWTVVQEMRAASVVPSGLGPTQVMDRLTRAARAAIRTPGIPASRALGAARARVLREIKRLRSAEYIGAAKEALGRVEAAVRVGSEAAIDRAVYWQTYQKQQARIRGVADTERVRAFSEGYRAQAATMDGVQGFYWNTDEGACEECEAKRGPTTDSPPLHMHCRCWLSLILAAR